MFFHIVFPGMIVLTALLLVPHEGSAQRMNHPNFGGGGGRPSAAPPPNFNRARSAAEPTCAFAGCQSSATTESKPAC